MPTSALAPLAGHLAAAEAALEAGDPLAAAEAVTAGVRVCTELDRGGVTLDPAEVSRLAACQQRLLARAVQARDALAEQLRNAGQSRRATAAYGRR